MDFRARAYVLRSLSNEPGYLPQVDGIEFLSSRAVTSLFSPRELRAASQLLTNINGPYCTGQSTWTQIIQHEFPDVAYLPEVVAHRDYRPGETPGKYQEKVEVTEFEEMMREGQLFCCIRRGAGTDRLKLTGLPVRRLKELLAEGKPVLMNVNLRRLAALDEEGMGSPPFPSILTFATPQTHAAMLRMRNRPPSDAAAGLYGIPLANDIGVSGIVPLETELIEGVEELPEHLRQQIVKAEVTNRLSRPLTENEAKLANVTRDHFVSRRDLLHQVLFRESRNLGQRSYWLWARDQGAREAHEDDEVTSDDLACC